MQFIHQALAWGFLIALAPVLIHLINMMRHRRVRWAAMEFLLQSYRKHRKWVWLKQLLLLLMRMAAVALVVAMLAGWVSRERWLAVFGQRTTHHYLLLDDSYSMSERAGGASAFERGLQAVSRIAARARAEDHECRFTLIRFSRVGGAADAGDESVEIANVADFNAEPVDADFDLSLSEKRNAFEITQLAVGPRPALRVVRQLMNEAADEDRVLYIISDFRSNQWDNPIEIREELRELEKSAARIELVGCAGSGRSNAAIAELRPSEETRAAGVPLFVEVTVKNFGAEPIRDLPLKIRSVCFDSDAETAGALGRSTGQTAELPTVLIDEIPPSGTVVRQAQVYFPKAGQHVVEAFLPDDPVEADNRRWRVIDFPEGEDVLIIDGHPSERNAFYLASVFQPGLRAATGVRPERKPPAFLRDATLEALNAYCAIYLLDVDRLDDRAVQNLEAYVEGGGGLGVFVGEHVNIAFYNERLHRGGEGLFPLPLDRGDVLPPKLIEKTPDIEVSDHPLFRVFLGERNPLIRLVAVDRCLKPPDDWAPSADSTVNIAARLRNGLPLVVERQFGQGRVLAFLTTLAPDWNNWAQDPSFVVVLLKLQSYLASARRSHDSRLAGVPIDVPLDADKHRNTVTFVIPGRQAEARIEMQRTATRPAADSAVMVASLGRAQIDGQRSGETDRSGVYEAWPITLEGAFDVRRFAVNVDPLEGNLTTTAPDLLVSKLAPVEVRFRRAEQYERVPAEQAGFNRSLFLMCLLICLLLGEQAMAYFASYHPARGGAR